MIRKDTAHVGDRATTHRNLTLAWQGNGTSHHLVLPPALTDVMWPDVPHSVAFWVRVNSLGTLFPSRGVHIIAGTNNGGTQPRLKREVISFQETALLWGFNNVPSVFLKQWQYNCGIGARRHVVITHDGSLNFAGTRAYVNGEEPPVGALVPILNPADLAKGPNSYATMLFDNNNGSAPFDYTGLEVTDLMICNNYQISPDQAKTMYHLATNQPSQYASRYPADVLANRWAHYPLGANTDFQIISTLLHATDISGNARHAEVVGQGTTPVLVPFQ